MNLNSKLLGILILFLSVFQVVHATVDNQACQEDDRKKMIVEAADIRMKAETNRIAFFKWVIDHKKSTSAIQKKAKKAIGICERSIKQYKAVKRNVTSLKADVDNASLRLYAIFLFRAYKSVEIEAELGIPSFPGMPSLPDLPPIIDDIWAWLPTPPDGGTDTDCDDAAFQATQACSASVNILSSCDAISDGEQMSQYQNCIMAGNDEKMKCEMAKSTGGNYQLDLSTWEYLQAFAQATCRELERNGGSNAPQTQTNTGN